MDTKTRPIYMLSTRDPFQIQRDIQTESKGMEKVFHASRSQKKSGVAIFMSDKINFKIKIVTREKEGHYIMIKESTQEDITVIYMHPTQEHLNT